MTFVKFIHLFLFTLALTSCNSAEDKIVDLSGGVFIVYVVLVCMKLASPKIVELGIYKNIASFISLHIRSFIYPLYVLAIIAIISGLLLGGIHKIHIFSGFIIAYIAYNLNKLPPKKSNGTNKVIVEIIALSISILFVLLLLWSLGTDLFNGF